MGGSIDGPAFMSYLDIYNNPDAAHWPGCYEPPDFSYVDRLYSIRGAKELWNLSADIKYPVGAQGIPIPVNVLITASGGIDTWNGSFLDILDLRCDALIEVIFEKPDDAFINSIWGKLDNNVWKYAINLFADIHNDQVFDYFEEYFNPATQSGHIIYPAGGNKTNFQHKQNVVEPLILN